MDGHRGGTLVRIWLAAVLILGACAAPPPPPAAEAQRVPAEFPADHYRQAREHGVLRVDPARSLVAIDVRRAGVLARLGHDHVVASRDVRGYVAPAEGRADLYVDLARLAVDEPGLRAEAGLGPPPPAEAVEGTRRNMLVRVLEAERHPFALIRIDRSPTDAARLRVAITLHGTTRRFDVPARIEAREGGLNVSGTLSFNQTDFGLVPMSVLGGALQVEDRLDLRFSILATPG